MNDLRLIAIWQSLAEAEAHAIDAISAVRRDPNADFRDALDKASTESAKANAAIREILAEQRDPTPP